MQDYFIFLLVLQFFKIMLKDNNKNFNKPTNIKWGWFLNIYQLLCVHAAFYNRKIVFIHFANGLVNLAKSHDINKTI